MSRSVALCGFKGCGKTTIGREAARRCRLPFVDVDALIEDELGMSCYQAAQVLGYPKFRSIEQQTVFSLDMSGPQVVSLGGGAVLRQETVAYIKQRAQLIYLEIDRDQALDRFFLRPTGLVSDRSEFDNLFDSRCALYEEIADVTIDVTAPTLYTTLHQVIHGC